VGVNLIFPEWLCEVEFCLNFTFLRSYQNHLELILVKFVGPLCHSLSGFPRSHTRYPTLGMRGYVGNSIPD